MQYGILTIDLDWVALKPVDGRANSGIEVLAEEMEAGWELLAVWWAGDHSCALMRRETTGNTD